MNAMGTKKSFEAGHRIIFQGEYIGTLREKNEFGDWTVDWEDGTSTGDDTFPESGFVHVNGGPGSAQRGTNSIKSEALLQAARELTAIIDTVQSSDSANSVDWQTGALAMRDQIRRLATIHGGNGND